MRGERGEEGRGEKTPLPCPSVFLFEGSALDLKSHAKSMAGEIRVPSDRLPQREARYPSVAGAVGLRGLGRPLTMRRSEVRALKGREAA